MTIQLIISYSVFYTFETVLKAHAWSLYAAHCRSCRRVTYAPPTLNMKNASLIFIWVKKSFREDIEHIHSSGDCKDNQVVRPQSMDKITLGIKYGVEIPDYNHKGSHCISIVHKNTNQGLKINLLNCSFPTLQACSEGDQGGSNSY